MASTDLVVQDIGDGDDAGLTTRQVQALEKLEKLGAGPAPKDPETGRSKYDANPQIRALQLVYEGRFGGAGRGQGRKRQPRVAEVMAEEIRQRFGKKMTKALERALRKEAGERVNLDAIKLAIDIERGERALQLQEEKVDDELSGSKEELLGTLFELVGDPAVGEALDAEFEDITDAEVVLDDNRSGATEEARDERPQNAPVYNFQKPRRASSARTNGRAGDSADPAQNGSDSRSARSNGRGRTEGNRQTGKSPSIQAALRRSRERR